MSDKNIIFKIKLILYVQIGQPVQVALPEGLDIIINMKLKLNILKNYLVRIINQRFGTTEKSVFGVMVWTENWIDQKKNLKVHSKIQKPPPVALGW
jgi:hypothetical protein